MIMYCNKLFKTYEFFICGIFHLTCLEHIWQQVAEIMESEG
jgi:hypothetical protein